MSAELALNFCATEQVTANFSSMILTLASVKDIFKEAIKLNKEKNSVDFIRQDLKTLANAKNAILDEKIADKLDEEIEKKKQELDEKTKQKTENSEKISKLSIAYKEFEYYASIVKCIHDSSDVNSFIDIDGLSMDEHFAFLFAGISLDLETINESASQYAYGKAEDFFNTGRKAVEELFTK